MQRRVFPASMQGASAQQAASDMAAAARDVARLSARCDALGKDAEDKVAAAR